MDIYWVVTEPRETIKEAVSDFLKLFDEMPKDKILYWRSSPIVWNCGGKAQVKARVIASSEVNKKLGSPIEKIERIDPFMLNIDSDPIKPGITLVRQNVS